MSLEVYFEPLSEWPGESTKTWSRKTSPFKATLDVTYKQLEVELTHLDVKEAVIQVQCDRSQLRRDGWLRGDARMKGPGVVLSFTSKHGEQCFPCDTFNEFKGNLRAIVLSLEALRRMDRYGVTKRGEQYRGWQRLDSPNGDHWTKQHALDFLKRLVPGTLKADGLEVAIVQAERLTHPDKGGDANDFKKVQRARELLL